MEKATIIVSGKNGQLGYELQTIQMEYPEFEFVFYDKSEWDICDSKRTRNILQETHAKYLINTAAYTAVDKAESEPELAYKINAEAVKSLAIECKQSQCMLVHLSTDYVYHRNTMHTNTEEDATNPLSVYGKTKLEGERLAREINQQSIIFRTSWVYSNHGHNFVKTMLRLAQTNNTIKVVNDQIGCPTYARDLAHACLQIIQKHQTDPSTFKYGIYNYANEGLTDWYGFAEEIFKYNNLEVNLEPLTTEMYNAPAPRPKNSVMNLHKIKETFNLQIPLWKESLHLCLDILKQSAL